MADCSRHAATDAAPRDDGRLESRTNGNSVSAPAAEGACGTGPGPHAPLCEAERAGTTRPAVPAGAAVRHDACRNIGFLSIIRGRTSGRADPWRILAARIRERHQFPGP